MYDESEEALSFEEEDEIMDDQTLNAEGLYYRAKSLKEDGNLDEALAVFAEVVSSNEEGGMDSTSVFKSIKQSIKIHAKLGSYEPIVGLLGSLLRVSETIDQAYAHASLHRIVTRMERYPKTVQRALYSLLDVYLSTHRAISNDLKRVRMKIDLSLVNVLMAEGELSQAMAILHRLELSLDGLSGSLKGTYLLDVIAAQLMIIMNSSETDVDAVRRLVEMSADHMLGIPHARVVGVVNEGKGLVAMHDRDYVSANDFFRASFKGFNDAGDDRRVSVMAKYVISSLLCRSQVNPFDSNDFQGLLKLQQSVWLMELYKCVQSNNVRRFNLCVFNWGPLTPFMGRFLPDVQELIKINYLLKTIPLLRKVSFTYLCEELDTHENDLLSIVFKLYSQGHLQNVKVNFNEKFIESSNAPNLLQDVDVLGVVDRLLTMKPIEAPNKELRLLVDRYLDAAENGKPLDINEVQMYTSPARKTVNGESTVRQRAHTLYLPISAVHDAFDSLTLQSTCMPSWNLLGDPIDVLRYHVKLLQDSIPKPREIEQSMLERVGVDRDEVESLKIYQGKTISTTNPNTENKLRLFQSDSNIPEVVQHSEMGAIAPPDNPILPKPPLLEQLEIKLTNLRMITNTLNEYGIESRVEQKGLKFGQLYDKDASSNKRSHHQFRQLDEMLERAPPPAGLFGRGQIPTLRQFHQMHMSEVSSQTSDDEDARSQRESQDPEDFDDLSSS